MEYKNIQDIKEIFERKITKLKSCLDNWERVQILYKKDGTHYKKITDTFRGLFFKHINDYYEITLVYNTGDRLYHDRLYIDDKKATAAEIMKLINDHKKELAENLESLEAEYNRLNDTINNIDALIKPLKGFLNNLYKTTDASYLYNEYINYKIFG